MQYAKYDSNGSDIDVSKAVHVVEKNALSELAEEDRAIVTDCDSSDAVLA